MFSLHPQLQADTFTIGELALSTALLMNNSELPWIILVPRRKNIKEWHQLTPKDQVQLHSESMLIGRGLMKLYDGDKLNTGALGNLVPQLHVHHIVRFKNDSVWPSPVWGNIGFHPYSESKLKDTISALRQALNEESRDFKEC